jgi:D-amino-acid dehydrogenase
MSEKGLHCIVIGAGIVGASCAWHLRHRGCEVTLLDRELPGMATSFGNAGCISPSQLAPFSYPGVWKKVPGWLRDEMGPLTIRWPQLPWLAPWLIRFLRAGTAEGVRRSAEAQAQLMRHVPDDWDDILQATDQASMKTSKGLVVLFDSREEFEDARWQYELDEKLGFEWNYLGPDELKIMAPALKPADKGVALHIPCWQHLADPSKVTAAIARSAIDSGALWRQAPVTIVGANADGVHAVTEDGERVEADALVVAGGPWSNALAGQLDYTVPMTPKRGYHAMLSAPGVALDYPVMSATRSFVMTPMADGLRLAGTAEFARLDSAPNYRRAEILKQHASSYLPGLKTEPATQWMGQRPMMVDSVPVISVSPAHRNVFYAFGHGHYGLTQGPTTGRIITELVCGDDTGLDLAPYRFDRFRGHK